MTKYIAFDSSHKTRGNIDENYSDLKGLLNSKDFECFKFIDMITQSTLKPYDILVFACPDFAKISSQEINEIEAWVKNDGGGLLLLSHAGGDRGRSSNLNEIGEKFGIAFENDQVLDERSNLGLENLPVIYNTNFNPPHAITNDIDSLCYRAGCSLSIIGGGAFAIATSNDTSDPFQTPLMCISEAGNGRICAIGSYEMFRNKVGGGLAYKDHSNLAINIFNWLVSETRSEIRVSQGIQPPSTQVRTQVGQYPTSQNQISSERGVDIDTANINYDIRISTKSELMALLKLFSDQINTIQKTINTLINKVAVEDESSFQGETFSQNVPIYQDTQQKSQYQYEEQEYSQDYAGQQYETYDQGESSYYETGEDENFIDYAYHSQGKHTLSSLPQKPSSLIETEEKSDSMKAPKFKSSSKSKGKKGASEIDVESLKAEKESLGGKINSVKQLMTFTDKKYKSGKLDDKSHDKQIKKLEKDLSNAQNRIDAIDKILSKK